MGFALLNVSFTDEHHWEITILANVMGCVVRQGHLKITRILNENRSDGYSNMSFQVAAVLGHCEIVEHLCARRSEANHSRLLARARAARFEGDQGLLSRDDAQHSNRSNIHYCEV